MSGLSTAAASLLFAALVVSACLENIRINSCIKITLNPMHPAVSSFSKMWGDSKQSKFIGTGKGCQLSILSTISQLNFELCSFWLKFSYYFCIDFSLISDIKPNVDFEQNFLINFLIHAVAYSNSTNLWISY